MHECVKECVCTRTHLSWVVLSCIECVFILIFVHNKPHKQHFKEIPLSLQNEKNNEMYFDGFNHHLYLPY